MSEQITLKDILKEKVHPAVGIDEKGLFFFVNKAFEQAYGWSEDDLCGELITQIIPLYMRDAHNFGFSRFLTTEAPRILHKPLRLPTQCKDGTVVDAEHIIVGEKQQGVWRFAALIKLIHE